MSNGNWFTDALGAAGGYYMGKEGIEGAMETGVKGQEMSQELAEDVYGKTEFVPYNVTTGFGTTTTDPRGGMTVRLSPQQRAFQQQAMGEAGGMLGNIGMPIDQAQQDIYSQIRATQQPEEERQRLALEERMLSQGRMGMQSAAYGGSSPELLAQAQAQQEAMLNANLAARGQALGEQKQRYEIGTGMLGAAYTPQEQALAAMGVGTDVAGLAEIGRRTGAELYGQIGKTGVESYMQGADLANRLQLQQQQALMNSLFGNQPTMKEMISAKAVGLDPSQMGQGGWMSMLGFGDAETPEWIKQMGYDYLGLGGGDDDEDDT